MNTKTTRDMKKNQELFDGTAIGDSRAAVIMIRISASEQENSSNSVNIQKRTCQDYAKDNGIAVVGYCLMTDITTKDKLFMDTITNITKMEANTLLVYSYDRLSRIGTELSAIVDYLNTKGISVISATQPFELK